MKKIAFILASLTLALTISSCAPRDTTIPDGMQRLTNEVINYNLYVPDDWTESDSNGMIGAFCSNEDPTNVSVMAWNVDSTMTLDAWWEQYKSDIELVFDEVTLTATEPVTLKTTSGGTVAANKYTYTAKLGEYVYQYVQCACLHWSMLYVITITTQPDLYESHTGDIEDIIGYFEFH